MLDDDVILYPAASAVVVLGPLNHGLPSNLPLGKGSPSGGSPETTERPSLNPDHE